MPSAKQAKQASPDGPRSLLSAFAAAKAAPPPLPQGSTPFEHDVDVRAAEAAVHGMPSPASHAKPGGLGCHLENMDADEDADEAFLAALNGSSDFGSTVTFVLVDSLVGQPGPSQVNSLR